MILRIIYVLLPSHGVMASGFFMPHSNKKFGTPVHPSQNEIKTHRTKAEKRLILQRRYATFNLYFHLGLRSLLLERMLAVVLPNVTICDSSLSCRDKHITVHHSKRLALLQIFTKEQIVVHEIIKKDVVSKLCSYLQLSLFIFI